jgi:hypothetical protein
LQGARITRKNILPYAIGFLLLLIIVQTASAAVYDLQIAVPKVVYGPSERVEIYGNLTNLSSSSGVRNASVIVNIVNSSGSVSNYTLNTTSDGIFYSRSDYNSNATLISTPNAIGNYTINATYTDPDGVLYVSSALINVITTRVDDIRIKTNEPVYYPSSTMVITAETVTVVGDYRLPVANIQINGTIRNTNETVLSSFNCTTNSNGKCTATKTAPSTSGNYIIESNNYIGFTSFKVVPFEVDVYIKDDTANTLKNTFQRGQTGYVEVRASYNGTNPTGEFTAAGNIYDSSGTIVSSLSSISLNSNNSYVNTASFSVGSSAAIGFYVARVVSTHLS